jgi:hypothetical protein
MKKKNLVKQIFNNLFGREVMDKVIVIERVPNYTEDMVVEMVNKYTATPTKATVTALSLELGKTTRSIVAKLVREGVYKAEPRVTKTGAPVVRKAELVASVEEALNLELPTLEKASKADLEALVKSIEALVAAEKVAQ